ncbi:FHA domain-containing protein [Pendulispora brunnea]|uniref:FHA domain-containing protein n=1 Tax=Pendulispora brunnea TaxID=2905690 RepID=A0ABZ2K2Z4_9BACT
MAQPTRRLIVARGLNVGAQLIINHDVKMVGRARDANLRLDDRSVSRHHFHVVATEQGARIHVCDGAAPLLYRGKEIAEAIVKVGDTVVVGDTYLLVTEAADADDFEEVPRYRASITKDVHTLFTGVAADVRGLAAVFALDEALGGATDPPSIARALEGWAKSYAECEVVEFVPPSGEQPASRDGLTVLEMATGDGRTKIAVPLPGTSAGWLEFTTRTRDKVTDSLRRLLVVAGRICALRFALAQAVQDARETTPPTTEEPWRR